MSDQPQLARKITLPLLVCYGLGTILGAGIYVLVGKIAGASGLLAPMAFIVAACVASITGLSYCQMVVINPKSSGEAYYVDQAFGRAWLTRVVGLLVVFTGVVSCATLARGFVGYLQSFIDIPSALALIAVVLFMATLALWGIAESLWTTAIITLIEIAGLILVITVGAVHIDFSALQWAPMFIPDSTTHLALILSGAFLAFYAFIGFEDMVNVVEEVKQPERNMPRAIIIAMLVSSLIYIAVTIVAVAGMPLNELASSEAPLRSLLEQYNQQYGLWISVISLFAIVNGVLTQIIMASRVLYGMARQGRLPAALALVSTRTRTPWVSTIVVAALVLTFALALPLVTLASSTSFIVLTVFALVNISLIREKKRIPDAFSNLRTPAFPKTGLVLCLCLLGFQLFQVQLS